ncbi:MAG: hypothetical protein JWM12_3400 [Ilumatobacteraceae bacterium]|nr:hypothetical protein [Ilumatobacteraceae bacterium]
MRLFDEWWSYLPAGIVDDLHRDLGISYVGAGWLLSLLTLGALVGSPLSLLADHADRRVCAVTGALLVAAGLTTYALGAPFVVLAIATSTLGTASDLLVDSIEAAVSELPDVGGDDDDREHRERLDHDALDRVLGRQHALSSVGDLIGPLLLALGASTAVGWRGAFAITALVMVGDAAYLATVDFPAPQDAATGMRAMVAEAIVVARRRDVWHLAAIEALIAPLDEPLLAFVVARAAADSASEAVAQLLAVAVVVGGVGGSILVGRVGISPRTRRRGPFVILVGTAAAVLPMSVVVQAVGMAAVGGGLAILWADVHLRTLTLVPGRAATVSTVVGVIGTAAAFVPVITGALADRGGLRVGLIVYLAVAAAVLVAAPRDEPPASASSAR